MGLGQAPQRAERCRGRNRAGNPMPAGQHALDVAVQDRCARAVALGDDRRRGGAADAGQRLRRRHVVRDDAAVVPRDDARGAMQVARPGVVAQAAPQVEHLVGVGACQGVHVWKPRDEPLEVGDDRRHLGLLEHDLRHPHAVGRALPLPGQVLAAVGVPPGKHAAGERACRRAAPGSVAASTCGHSGSFNQTGLRPEPPASARGDPCAPRRSRRGALCAPGSWSPRTCWPSRCSQTLIIALLGSSPKPISMAAR